MHGHPHPLGVFAAFVTAGSGALAQSASFDQPIGVNPPPVAVGVAQPAAPAPNADQPSSVLPETRVAQVSKKGFVFFPSVQDPRAFRFALGAYYDAIDPAVLYGFKFRLPQVTLDARYGLGSGWSLKGHLNSMFVTTELLLGASYAARAGNWSVEGTFTAGIYVGKLGQAGFDALLLSPEYRPEVTLGYDLGHIALSLRASLMLLGPDRVRVGDAWGSLDGASAFAGHSEMLFVENTTQSNGVWYFGLGAVTARPYYALWLLFPDTPGLYTYPRIVAGYEF